MKEKSCLWCGKSFEWDAGMYQFCTPCIQKLEAIEKVVEIYFGKTFNITNKIEKVLLKKIKLK